MVSKVAANDFRYNKWFWALALAFLAGALAQYHWLTLSVLFRFILLMAGLTVCVFALAKTEQGTQVWQLWQESCHEVRKVVWPTRQETTQTTLVVLAMVVVAGLLLWTADACFLRLVGWLMGLARGVV